MAQFLYQPSPSRDQYRASLEYCRHLKFKRTETIYFRFYERGPLRHNVYLVHLCAAFIHLYTQSNAK